MGEEHFVGRQLLLSESGHWVRGSGGKADHAAVRGRDGEGDVGGSGVTVKSSQLRGSAMWKDIKWGKMLQELSW